MMNRLGNAISYQDAQSYIGTMAHEVDMQTAHNNVFIPNSMKKDHFTQFAFDNLDFQEYTKDGRTQHGTTNIIFQYLDENEQILPIASVPLAKGENFQYQSFNHSQQ